VVALVAGKFSNAETLNLSVISLSAFQILAFSFRRNFPFAGWKTFDVDSLHGFDWRKFVKFA